MPAGLFAFEMKNYSGWIYGSPHDRNWTETFPQRTEQCYHPLCQNAARVAALKAYPWGRCPDWSTIRPGCVARIAGVTIRHHIVGGISGRCPRVAQ